MYAITVVEGVLRTCNYINCVGVLPCFLSNTSAMGYMHPVYSTIWQSLFFLSNSFAKRYAS